MILRRALCVRGQASITILVSAHVGFRDAIIDRAVERKDDRGPGGSSDGRRGESSKREERVRCDLLHESLEPDSDVVPGDAHVEDVPAFERTADRYGKVCVGRAPI